MSCPHRPDVVHAAPARNALRVNVVEHIDSRCHGGACYWPDRQEIDVEREFWETIGYHHQTAVLAHELAHHEGHACESCADTRAGAIMRAWGLARDFSARLLEDVAQGSRVGVAHNAARGWEAMNVQMA